jgi:single-stranded-DNA-specific exonuclease
VLDNSTPEFPQARQRLPKQRWQIHPQNPELAQKLANAANISPIISQLLLNRGVETPSAVEIFLNPELHILPKPLNEFPDLPRSVELLQDAIAQDKKIAICGDYDADGMTSTALLLRCLRWLNARVDYAIPSRMKDGYGINQRIVEEFHSEGVQLILTVDNGISAFDPIARARELGISVIVTDHHDIPEKLPPANAILNPKLIPESSPYRGLAGVGVAYILAVSLAQQLGNAQGLIKPMLELFTLGTIADLAPLSGVNRRWVKRGLQLLPKSKLPGVQALIQVAGVQASRDAGQELLSREQGAGSREQGAGRQGEKGGAEQSNLSASPRPPFAASSSQSPVPNPKSLKPEDIGFRLGPRINAVGRIADPQIVIDLLTCDDMGIALERAMQCEQTNIRRQQMCEQIELEAIAVVETLYAKSLQQDCVLVIVEPNWHHGVIGIVASRLVERYGVPVFIGTYETLATDAEHIRGSARGIPEFHVFEALVYCQDLLGKFGGHKAAGGFSVPADNLQAFRERLIEFANECLQPQHLKPLLKIDAQANLLDVNSQLYQQINALHPCGIDNPDPVFWTPNVQVVEQGTVGKGHIKVTLAQTINNQQFRIKAIAWRWRDYFPLPPRIDIAYKLRENNFNGSTSMELELLGARLPAQSQLFFPSIQKPLKAAFDCNGRRYTCGIYPNGASQQLRIKNPQGTVLAVSPEHTTGLLGTTREDAKEVDVSQPQYHSIIQAALQALKSVMSASS